MRKDILFKLLRKNAKSKCLLADKTDARFHIFGSSDWRMNTYPGGVGTNVGEGSEVAATFCDITTG